MKHLKKYQTYHDESLNESWKDIVLGALVGLSTLVANPAFARGGGGGGHSSGSHGSSSHGSSSHGSGHAGEHSSGFHGGVGKSGHITRTGRGGIHGDDNSHFSVNRMIYYNHSYHQTTEDYGDYYNQLLNDLDSIPIKDSTLEEIKNKLAWSNHKDTLDIPGIANQLKVVCKNQGYNDLLPILDSLSSVKLESIQKMSQSEKDHTKKKFEILIQDLKSIAEDESVSNTTVLFIFLVLLALMATVFFIVGKMAKL